MVTSARQIALCLVATMLMTGAAMAQAAETDAAGDAAAGRYTMTQTEDGILRLDTATGEVSHCRRKDTGWACQTAADDRTALMEELDRLERENAELRLQIADLKKSGKNAVKPDLPSDEELDQIMGFFEKMMRRFFEFARTMRETFQQDET